MDESTEAEATAVPILNREFQLPEDGWYQLAPIGEFPHAVAGVTQVVDREAVDRMVNAFRKDSKRKGFGGLLVDFDHFSLSNTTPSKAAGWATEVRAREDGLWGKIRWSRSGKEAVEGGDYRFISPVWNREDCEDLGGGKVRPTRLRNAAVTNEPNLRGIAPLSNRSEAAQVETVAIGVAGDKPVGDDGMKDIAKAVGLAEDATKEAVLNRVQEIVSAAAQVEPLKNRVAEFETAALNAQVEKDLDAHKDVIGSRDEAKKALLANREATLSAWALLKKPAPASPLPNRADGQPPSEDDPSGTPSRVDRRAEQTKVVDEVLKNRRCASRAQALEFAQAEKPELFR